MLTDLALAVMMILSLAFILVAAMYYADRRWTEMEDRHDFEEHVEDAINLTK